MSGAEKATRPSPAVVGWVVTGRSKEETTMDGAHLGYLFMIGLGDVRWRNSIGDKGAAVNLSVAPVWTAGTTMRCK